MLGEVGSVCLMGIIFALVMLAVMVGRDNGEGF